MQLQSVKLDFSGENQLAASQSKVFTHALVAKTSVWVANGVFTPNYSYVMGQGKATNDGLVSRDP